MPKRGKPRAKQRRKRAGSGKAPKSQNRYGNESIHKDPLDLRDYYYEGSLSALPSGIDNRRSVPKILDQESEGACTGFGLAAVVNYLLHNHPERGPISAGDRVSPRMLYEMARRYDEWPGEAYEGSSIRGAMKGWHRHGVCKESLWKYRVKDPGRLTPTARGDAVRRPLGNYFRVRHRWLTHMHAALREVGILLASAQVHEGWERVNRRDGKIPFSRKIIGGHAFAIVGYDDEGLWIQNSWGPSWGNQGFAHLSYEDWLEHGWDCWVARLGVPTKVRSLKTTGLGGRATTFDYITDEAVVLDAIRPHFVNLGNEGTLSASGRYSTSEDDVHHIFRTTISEHAEQWATPRLLLYAHGGLNTEVASAQRIASFHPHFEHNEIYPLHFMWETGLTDTIGNIVADAFRTRRFTGWRDEMKKRFRELLDEAIEFAARPLGRAVWREMQENARKASNTGGGATLVAEEIASYIRRNGPIEVHLVGHSAGSILHAHLIPRLVERDVPIQSLTLYAPACTTDLFTTNIAPHLGGAIHEFALFNLADEAEQDDSVGPYGKSLLYLVSEAFEDKKKAPILGMDAFIREDAGLRRRVGRRAPSTPTAKTVIYTRDLRTRLKLTSGSSTHGGFDNDEDTLNSTLSIVLHKRPENPFPDTA
jgi:hypothetical protein